MRYDAQFLNRLVPAIYRLRDQVRREAPHGPLEALLTAIAEQVAGVEDNIDQLYDDLFIETCADWVVPYLGDLIGYEPLRGVTTAVHSPRAEVANTISYRRAKGTLTVLERLASDLTDWPAVAVECFQYLAQTQFLNHLRPAHPSLVSLRNPFPSLADSPVFQRPPRSVEVRRIGTRRGMWNIPNIAIFLHRLVAFPVLKGRPRQVDPVTHPGRFIFHPLGVDAPLFQQDRPLSTDDARASAPHHVPGPASPRRLHQELEHRRELLNAGAGSDVIERDAVGFGMNEPVFQIRVGGVPVDPQFIKICDLSTWQPSTVPGIRASVDVKLGRFVLHNSPGALPVHTDYWYGSAGRYGAGTYPRSEPQDGALTVLDTDNLEDIITTVLAGPVSKPTVRVPNNHTYAGPFDITVPADRSLTVRAASGNRPVIDGDLNISLGPGASILIEGFLIGGTVIVQGGIGTVTMRSSTIQEFRWQGAAGGTLRLKCCFTGRLILHPLTELLASECLINGGSDTLAAIRGLSPSATAGALTLQAVTVLGEVAVREIKLIEDTIVTGRVGADRTQQGCVRFSYLPPGSQTPPRYQCQPETAAQRAVATALLGNPNLTLAQANEIRARQEATVRPDFTSRDPAHAAYGQFGFRCSQDIREGAEFGSEMGVYRALEQPIRERNLRQRIDEYLRIGLEVGIFYAH